MALDNAATLARELATVVGVAPRPGLDAARLAHGQAAPTPPPARLAGQWYPRPAGIAEPTIPSTTVPAQPVVPPRPDRRLAR